jgi:hypothetical protein
MQQFFAHYGVTTTHFVPSMLAAFVASLDADSVASGSAITSCAPVINGHQNSHTETSKLHGVFCATTYRDPQAMQQFFAHYGVTTTHFVPSMLAAFVASLDGFRRAVQVMQRRAGQALPLAAQFRRQRFAAAEYPSGLRA